MLKETLKQHDRTNMLKIAVAKTITETHDHKAKDAIDILHNEVTKLTEELTQANVNISELTHDNQVKDDKLAKLGDAYAARKSELAAANQLIQKLTKELNDKKLEFKELEEAKAVVDEELVGTKKSLAEANDMIATTEEKLENTTETLHVTEDNLAVAKENIETLTSKLHQCEESLADADKRIAYNS